jgi:hypothetical protein
LLHLPQQPYQTMKQLIPIVFILLLATAFPACNNYEEKKNPSVLFDKEPAVGETDNRPALVKSLIGLGLNNFEEWSYSNKGSDITKVWYKHSGDKSIFSCQFLYVDGQEHIVITNPQSFADFLHLPLKMGTALTGQVRRSGDSLLFTRLNMQTATYEPAGIITGKKAEELFSDTGMFGYLKKLGTALDQVGVNEVQPYKGRIRFIMKNGLIFTYLPDNVDENFRKAETEGSKQIQPGWWSYMGGAR